MSADIDARTDEVPARLFGLVAREAPIAVVFRRGPSRHVQQLVWNLETDEITPGQWLKHRVYPRRCDLSADGKNLLYFAAPFKGQIDSYSAISHPPYFTARSLVPHGGAWNGGGAFLSNSTYWIDRNGPTDCDGKTLDHPTSRFRRVMDQPAHIPAAMGEDLVLYIPRLLRDGWHEEGHEREGTGWKVTDRFTFSRGVTRAWKLVKTVTASTTDRGPEDQIYWETHVLTDGSDHIELNDCWAEVFDGDVVFARAGVLLRLTPGQPEREIADLTPNRFEGVPAPYEGLSRLRPSAAKSSDTHLGIGTWHPLDADDLQ